MAPANPPEASDPPESPLRKPSEASDGPECRRPEQNDLLMTWNGAAQRRIDSFWIVMDLFRAPSASNGKESNGSSRHRDVYDHTSG
jgi:hypothetical protein